MWLIGQEFSQKTSVKDFGLLTYDVAWLVTWFLLFLQNVRNHLLSNAASHPKRLESLIITVLWKPQKLAKCQSFKHTHTHTHTHTHASPTPTRLTALPIENRQVLSPVKHITTLLASSHDLVRCNNTSQVCLTCSTFGGLPSLNWMIFCVVGRNCEQPVYGLRASESRPSCDEPSWPTSYSSGPWRKCCRVISNMRPTRSVVDTPAVLWTSLNKE